MIPIVSTSLRITPLVAPALPEQPRLAEKAKFMPQPLLTVYVIVDAPGLTADTNPVTEFTVATPGALLLQVPPGVPLLV